MSIASQACLARRSTAARPVPVCPLTAAGLELAPTIARQVHRHVSSRFSLDEILAFAREGALNAARSFDPSRGASFDYWATLKIRGAIIDGVRTLGPLPRALYRRLRAMEDAAFAAAAAEAFGGESEAPAAVPEAGDAACADEWLSGHLEAMATAMAMRCLVRNQESVLGALRSDAPTPEEELAREEMKALVREAIAERPAIERTLLERYYFEGCTLEQAAGGLSRSWACRIHARAISGVAKSLKRRERAAA
ncbi:MAG TPA: sigma-70 family RNA polymerase sigma factor [Polyangiaceae bacterium]